MLQLNVKNETSRLRAVVLGTAVSNGPTPTIEEAYDPKSLEHIKAGTYPVEADMVNEMEAFNKVFQKYDVKVFRPQIIENYNQIFARDIGFVIDDIFIKANILPDRERELDAIQYVIDQIEPKKVVRPPEEVHIEGVVVITDHTIAFQYEQMIYQLIHKVPVMGDYDQTSGKIQQILFQNIECDDIEIIGWLIQYKKIGIFHKDGEQV